jgi:hypothetical protein
MVHAAGRFGLSCGSERYSGLLPRVALLMHLREGWEL